jgi:hypothetical protein
MYVKLLFLNLRYAFELLIVHRAKHDSFMHPLDLVCVEPESEVQEVQSRAE